MSQLNPYEAPTDTATQQVNPADRDLKWMMTSFEGRIGRKEYWMNSLLLSAVVMVPIGVLVGLVVAMDNDALTMTILSIAGLAMLPLIWCSLALQVKRWHDRNKSGLWALIGIVPYIGGIWQFVECGCLRGTDGPNRYGEDPLSGMS